MTKALDDAVDAIHAMIDRCVETGEEFGTRDEVRAALRAALPAEPTAEAIAVMTAAAAAGWPRHEFRDAYRALRAHLLGEDA